MNLDHLNFGRDGATRNNDCWQLDISPGDSTRYRLLVTSEPGTDTLHVHWLRVGLYRTTRHSGATWRLGLGFQGPGFRVCLHAPTATHV